MTIVFPLKSFRLLRFLSLVIIPKIPHIETFNRLISMPLLYRFAATLVGIAIKSTAPLMVNALSSSGFFHRRNSIFLATSFKAPVSIICIIGCETLANGPAITNFSIFPSAQSKVSKSAKRIVIFLNIIFLIN